jgi:hypothetical protein
MAAGSGRERYVVVGLAHPRAAWFTEVARWATAASLPVEFVKCVSVEELRARLGSGRAFSAVLLDASLAGVDRDLADLARGAGCAVFVVDDGRVRRDWMALGASVVLPSSLGRADLLDALAAHATPIGRGEAVGIAPSTAPRASWQGPLVAVTGVAGAGRSTVAAALSQGLGDDPRYAGVAVLADLALHAHQAVLHDAGDVVPGLPELVDAHRLGQPSIDEVRSLTFPVADRGYQLLLGLRRHRDWTALRPRAVEAAIESLRRSYRVVVADIDADFEGEDESGSTDVEDRNVLARTALASAAVVVVVGEPGVTRLHATVRVVEDVLRRAVDPRHVLTVVNRAPRTPRARAEVTRALAILLGAAPGGSHLASPLHLPHRRHLDDIVRDGRRLPSILAAPVTAAVEAVLARTGDEPGSGTGPATGSEPVPVAPGSLGSWSDETDDRGDG